jgi:phenylpyruvate tautomerase PptA (4-oxalocrotonate tautomerase family)
MPLYTITAQAGVLDGPAKSDLAEKLTAFHAEYAGIPRNWVHIVFYEYPIGSGFSAGRPSPTSQAPERLRWVAIGSFPSHSNESDSVCGATSLRRTMEV